MPVTLWYRWVVDKQTARWDFNHLSDGIESGEFPLPKLPIHSQSWKNGKWKAVHSVLDEHNCIIDNKELT